MVTINPGRPDARDVLCRMRSYVGRSCVVGGIMFGGFRAVHKLRHPIRGYWGGDQKMTERGGGTLGSVA